MTVFTNARLFNGTNERLIGGEAAFADGRMAEIWDRPPTLDDGEAIDCDGRTLMPGLIDAHIHAYSQSDNFHDNVGSSESLGACWAYQMLERMLDLGFTTMRDTGGADYGLFLGLERGWIRGRSSIIAAKRSARPAVTAISATRTIVATILWCAAAARST
ncbi:amidohydrolase family protein [Sphingomonas sp.]|uniref:amidohydrolase family protein n=1 Tax=Sphingomonas sp. TaxID=28214 RepID=UPI003D6C71D8